MNGKHGTRKPGALWLQATLHKSLVLELAPSEYATRRENRTGKTHIALGIGLAARRSGSITAAALLHELLEARDEKRLLRPQRQAAELLFEYSANATSAVQPPSHRTCRSTNGPACSVPSV